MFHQLTVPEWVDRFANRLGSLLPDLDPAEATLRALALQLDAYEHLPEEAAKVFALELPSVEAAQLCDYETAPHSAWVLAFQIDDATDDERQRGLRAARGVLDARSVTAFEASHAEFKLEGWGVGDLPDDMQLTESDMNAHEALSAAWNAAHEAIDSKWPVNRMRGEVVTRWPSKVRFEAAREKWRARQSIISWTVAATTC